MYHFALFLRLIKYNSTSYFYFNNNLIYQMTISNIKKGIEYAKHGYREYGSHYRKNQIKKIAFHTSINPRFTKWWFNYINHGKCKEIFQYRPLMYIKPYRVYISTKWKRKERIKVIMDSYLFLSRYPHLYNKYLTNEEGVVLSRIDLGEETNAEIRFWYDDQFRKEGEFVLTLYCEKYGGKIISTGFSVIKNESGWDCLVGCVQSHGNVAEKELLKKIQKKMHGMRPKALLMYTLQSFAHNSGCNSIKCISDKYHSYRKKHFIHLPYIHTIHFNYDEFWKEVGAIRYDDQWFSLKTSPTPNKDLSEIKSKKRAMYRRRYAMLEQINNDIVTQIN